MQVAPLTPGDIVDFLACYGANPRQGAGAPVQRQIKSLTMGAR